MISHSHKFIFIHIPKTAGSSVTSALRPYGPWQMRFKRLWGLMCAYQERKSRHTRLHAHAREIRAAIPKQFQAYYKFAFVRNPWDLLVSLHAYILKEKNHFEHAVVSRFSSFSEHLKWRAENSFFSQSEFVTDESGRIIVDYIGRFENIDADFPEACQGAGIAAPPLPRMNRSSHKDYRSYYDSATADLVAEYWKEDIERFRYSFE